MNRSLKKGIAFSLAMTMFSSSFAYAADAVKDEVVTIENAAYDEAVVFTDSVALLQNGHWAQEDNEELSVSTDTSIVFVDAEGNRTTIENKDSNGERLFDAVFPMISGGDSFGVIYQYDALKVIKDNKVSYIKADGSYFGDSLTYYNMAVPITNNFMMVSNESYINEETGKTDPSKEVKFDILNTDGKKVLELDTAVGGYAGRYDVVETEKYVYLENKGKVYRLDQMGTLMETYEGHSLTYVGDNYVSIRNQENLLLLNPEGEIFKKLDKEIGDLNISYLEQGYLVAKIRNISDFGWNWGNSKIIDIHSDKEIANIQYLDNFDGDIIVGENSDRIVSVSAVDGTVYLEDVHKYAETLVADENYESLTCFYMYVDESFILSVYDKSNSERAKTFVLTKENKFLKDENKVYDGILDEISFNEEYFLIGTVSGRVSYLCNVDGTLVQDYTDKELSQAKRIIKEYYDYNDDLSYQADIPGFLFTSKTKDGVVYIRTDGSVSEVYDSISAEGNFLLAEKDGKENVINTDNRIVYTGEKISAFWYKDCFYVNKDGRYYLYDREGNLLLGQDADYVVIGEEQKRISGNSPANMDDKYGTYRYRNQMLPNGLCIVRVAEGDIEKYGVIQIRTMLEESGIITVQKGDISYVSYEDCKTISVASLRRYYQDYDVKVYNKKGLQIYGNTSVGTGYQIYVYDKNSKLAYQDTAVIKGDVNGDAYIDVRDMEQIQKDALEISKIDDKDQYAAACTNNTGIFDREEYSISALDMETIYKSVVGLK